MPTLAIVIVNYNVRDLLLRCIASLKADGVHDIVVVDTPDALLVTTRANAQRVKSVVDALKLSGRSEVL